MPEYSGKYQYLDERGTALHAGPCRVRFDAETCIVAPASGAPLAFDLGDIDRVALSEWELSLNLFTGRVVQLRQFGKTFTPMSDELLRAWHDRTVRCLLLEDLEEAGRFTGTATPNKEAPSPAEIRLYKSNLAILPAAGAPFQWRLAEVDSWGFDDNAYTVTLRSGAEQLVVGKLGKNTERFVECLEKAISTLRTQSADALHRLFPFLDPDALARLAAFMPEGRSVPVAAFRDIHPELCDSLIAGAVDKRLKPYFDALRGIAGNGLMTGFKFIRKEDAVEQLAEGEEVAEEPAEDVEPEVEEEAEERQPLFFWFFFPLSNNLVAWEASTGSGRATYLFRFEGDVQEAVSRLTRGLALVNFRREPVYLPDGALEREQRFRRYAIGCRKLPDLRALRAAMLGRAIHSTLEKWQAQLRAFTK